MRDIKIQISRNDKNKPIQFHLAKRNKDSNEPDKNLKSINDSLTERGSVKRRRDWLSYKERRVDALALGADEGRDKLRKAAGRSIYPLIRGCPNGETRQRKSLSAAAEYISRVRGTA